MDESPLVHMDFDVSRDLYKKYYLGYVKSFRYSPHDKIINNPIITKADPDIIIRLNNLIINSHIEQLSSMAFLLR